MNGKSVMQVNFDEAAIMGRRSEQQDSKGNLIIADGYMLYVLADGMGGAAGGAIASQTVCNAFIAYFKTTDVSHDYEQHLRLALDKANDQLTDILREQPELNGMGTTIIAVLYQQASNYFWYLSVGDSPLYLLEAGGINRVNDNHAYYEELLEDVTAGNISQQEAEEHPQRHAITSAVMGKKLGMIDTGELPLNAGSLLLLASDGVQTLNDFPGGELESLLNAPDTTITDKVNSIITRVEQKNDPYQDNTSLILVEPTEPTLTNIHQTEMLNNTEDHDDEKKRTRKVIMIVTGILLFLLGSISTYILQNNSSYFESTESTPIKISGKQEQEIKMDPSDNIDSVAEEITATVKPDDRVANDPVNDIKEQLNAVAIDKKSER